MSNSPSPKPRPPYLRDDEPIALLIAFLAFGAIGFWVFQSQQSKRWDWASVGLTSPIIQTPNQASAQKQPTSVDPAVELSARQANDTAKKISASSVSSTPAVNEAEESFDSTTSPGLRPSWLQMPQLPKVGANPTGQPSGDIAAVETTTEPEASTEPAISTPAPAPSATPFFSDVPTTHWAYPQIQALAAQKMTVGFPDGTYRPDQPATRSGFAAMIEQAFTQPKTKVTKAFKDVSETGQQSQIVDEAVQSNFMTGYPDDTFKPDQTISRTEAIAAMVKGLNLPTPADPTTVLASYGDAKAIPKWAQDKVAAAVAAGLLSDQRNLSQINPSQVATRAEIAALVAKGLELNQAGAKP